MKNKYITRNRLVMFLFVLITVTMKIEAQDRLKNLTQIEPEILEGVAVVFDGISFPVYNEIGEKIDKEKVSAFFVSGDYIPELYVNKRKGKIKIKAAVFKERREGEELSEFYEKIRLELKAKRQGAFLKKKESTRIPTPNFVALDMSGTKYSLKDLRGKVVVLNFWFTHCKPCVKEFPILNEMVKKYKNREDIVFLAFTFNTKEQLKPFLEKHEFLYKIIPNSKKIIHDFNIITFPKNIIINTKGKIVLHSGFYRDVHSIENKIDELIN